jgi:hypothetical protein
MNELWERKPHDYPRWREFRIEPEPEPEPEPELEPKPVAIKNYAFKTAYPEFFWQTPLDASVNKTQKINNMHAAFLLVCYYRYWGAPWR